MPGRSLSELTTESISSELAGLHSRSIGELVDVMNREDEKVARAVGREVDAIEVVITQVSQRLANGGRLLYLGAGTSGRLGVLDASECVPTFVTPRVLSQGHIAGGDHALRNSIEAAEDSISSGAELIVSLGVTEKDSVIGITASGRTPFVIGAIDAAKRLGAYTAGLTCNKRSQLGEHTHDVIEVDVGPEVVAGSTRLKAGTATKMVLNMISTISMIRLGKIYQNLMIDVKVTNEKLWERAENILIHLSNCSRADAKSALIAANKEVRTALIVLLAGVTAETAREQLARDQFNLDRTLNTLQKVGK
ncbi:MAG: N-acetylmuramic acid 6-phosphate etherase [Actinomycetota bacterium]